MNNRRDRKGRARRLPPYVQVRYDPRDRALPVEKRRVLSYRGWAVIGGMRVYGPSRDDAVAAHRDAMALREADAVVPNAIVTLERAHAAMLEELGPVRKPGTADFYNCQAKAVWRWINKTLPVQRLTVGALHHMIGRARDGGFSARTISHYRRYLHRLLEWCRRRTWFRGENPVKLAEWPEPRRAQPDVLTEDELAGFLVLLEPRPNDYALALFLAYSGLRRAELARLHMADVDFDGGVFTVRGKTEDEHCPITAESLAPLRRLFDDAKARLERRPNAGTGHLVDGENEKRRVQAIDRVFRRWRAATARKDEHGKIVVDEDRRLHPHTLRHTLATVLIRKGVAEKTVQRMLRHASAATTQLYTHLVAKDVRAATSGLRFVRGGTAAQSDHG